MYFIIILVIVTVVITKTVFIPQQKHFAMGSLAQISSSAIRCSFNARFWARFRRVQVQKVPVQILKVQSLGFRPVQILRSGSGVEGIGGEGSGADIDVRSQKVPVQIKR